MTNRAILIIGVALWFFGVCADNVSSPRYAPFLTSAIVTELGALWCFIRLWGRYRSKWRFVLAFPVVIAGWVLIDAGSRLVSL
jgi:hypothetical protein